MPRGAGVGRAILAGGLWCGGQGVKAARRAIKRWHQPNRRVAAAERPQQPTDHQEAMMTDRRGSTATGGAAPADQPGGVRNVVLVGHSGSGKTTLVEALLSATGTIQRMGRVEDGTTVSD